MIPSARAPLSPYELRREGWKAPTGRLGIAGAMRFLMQYDPGHGDYTEERRGLFRDLSLEQALTEIRARERPGGA